MEQLQFIEKLQTTPDGFQIALAFTAMLPLDDERREKWAIRTFNIRDTPKRNAE